MTTSILVNRSEAARRISHFCFRVSRSHPGRSLTVPHGVFASTLIVILSAGLARAQCNAGVNAINWTGKTIGNWSAAGNWDLGCVPANGSGAFYDVTLTAAGHSNVAAYDNGGTTIDSLTLGSGMELNATGAAQVLVVGDASSPTDSTGILINDGLMLWRSGAELAVNNPSVINSGTVDMDASTLQVNGDFGVNLGDLALENGSTGNVTRSLNNWDGGSVQVTGSTLTVSNDLNNGNGTGSTGAQISLESGANLTVLGNFTNTSDHFGAGAYVLVDSGSTLAVGGGFSNTGEGDVTIQNGSNLTVLGEFTNASSANLILQGTGNSASLAVFQNSGTVEVDPGSTLNATRWLDLGSNGNLENGGTWGLSGGQFKYAFDESGATSSDILSIGTGTIVLTANGAALTLDANGSDVLISHDGGITSALDNLNTIYSNGWLELNGISQNLQGSLTNNGLLQVNEGSDMTIGNGGNGSLTNNNKVQIEQGSFMSVNGAVTNSSQLLVDGSQLIVRGDFNNSAGTLQMGGGGGTNGLIEVFGAGGFSNQGGTVNLNGTGDVLDALQFANRNGSVSIGKGELINIPDGTYAQSAGSTNVNGTLTAGLTSIQGGTLTGGGTIFGKVDNSGGKVIPLDADIPLPATLTINGSYQQETGGTLEIDLGGTGAGDFSVLGVQGTTMLDGTVDFTAVNGFTPAIGDDFTFLLSSAGVSGDFANMVLTNFSCPAGAVCTDVLATHSVTFEINAARPTPEPAACFLFGSSLLGLGALLRRRLGV